MNVMQLQVIFVIAVPTWNNIDIQKFDTEI